MISRALNRLAAVNGIIFVLSGGEKLPFRLVFRVKAVAALGEIVDERGKKNWHFRADK
jgi:hypothetical protein